MKTAKILLIFILLMSVFALVVSCEGENNGETAEEAASDGSPETVPASEGTEKETAPVSGNDTDAATEPSTDPAETNAAEPSVDLSGYYKYVTFEIPTDLRQAAIDKMKAESEVVWKCTKTFETSERFDYEGWGISLKYEEGKEYHGLPYANTYTTMEEFQTFYLDENGGYTTDSSSWKGIPGLECSSSIVMSLQTFADITGYTSSFCPGYDEFQAVKLGDYEAQSGWDSEDIVNANKAKKMFECYALLDKGDVIGHFKNGGGNHVRMIVENHVERKSDGSINSRKSYVICLEQTNAFDKTRTDGVNTTWYINHKYEYEKLFSTSYIPVTIKEYQTGRKDPIYIGLNSEIKAADLADGVFVGQIETNSVFRYVYFELYSKDGTLVKRFAHHGVQDYSDNVIGQKTRKLDLRKYYASFFNGVESGEYTFVLTAGVAAGNAELARVDFTYKK